MNEYAFPEEVVLNEPQKAGIGQSGTGHLPASAGSFSLRRAHYFTRTRRQPLSAEQQLAFLRHVREGDTAAKRVMIAHHMHLVVDFARHYSNRGPAPLDLIREGNQGLIHALENYDPEGGFSFQDCARQCICQNIERAIMKWNNSLYQYVSGTPLVRNAHRRSPPLS